MIEDKVEIEIELPEEEWNVLECCRVELGFETIDDLINNILKKAIEKEEKENGNKKNKKI